MSKFPHSLAVLLMATGLAACGSSSAPDGAGGGGSSSAPQASSDFSGREFDCVGEECTTGRFVDLGSEPTIRFTPDVDGEENTARASTRADPVTVETSEKCVVDETGVERCKPSAGSIALLPNNNVVYFNALEGTENVEASIVAEFGRISVNDQTRTLSFGGAGPRDRVRWTRPVPTDGGANAEEGNDSTTLLPTDFIDDSGRARSNDGALFCADLVQLADGRILASGGTDYFTEPSLSAVFPPAEEVLASIPGSVPLLNFGEISVPDDIGVVELEGVKNARIFNARTELWEQTGDMSRGRWYPTMVTLPDNDVFITSGVTKLLKPVFLGNLENPGPQNLTEALHSGDNVRVSERYDLETGTWSEFGSRVDLGGVELNTAERALPLFPRMHLLPNGLVMYNAAGQAFNPFGQSYNQAQWNFVSVFNPEGGEEGNGEWADIAFAGLPVDLADIGLGRLNNLLTLTDPTNADALIETLQGLPDLLINSPEELQELAESLADPSALFRIAGAGFRGSTFSIMMPLEPDENGQYNKAEFLTAGGVLGLVGVTSPGAYIGTPFSRIDTITLDPSEADPVAQIDYSSRVTGDLGRLRWYPSGVLLPDGSVMAFNGADRDEVVLPGLGVPVQMAQRFDPVTETWEDMTESLRARTYHNTALLMPDGRVLVGGHAPISTGYLNSINFESIGLSPNDGRDPSFEIYEPPYMFRDDRPSISGAPDQVRRGQNFSVSTPDAADITEVLLIRRTATTHLVDGDQRAVKLPFSLQGQGLAVQMPDNPAVVPSGHYMLFISRTAEDGTVVPSTSVPVRVPL